MSASSHNLAESAVHARIRDKLNIEGIKLWMEPFYNAEGVNDTEMMALAGRYSTELEFSEAEVLEWMYTLQRNAIERLAERQTYQETGLATVRLRFSGFKGDKLKSGLNDKIQVNLFQTGKELKEVVAKLVDVSENGLKLICAGKVVDEMRTLDGQNMKNGCQVMVLSIATDHENLKEVENQLKELEETKNSANFLADKDGTDGLYSLQVADQSGKALNLPDLEKKALTVALTLHEKGRALMKAQQFSKSLVYLLEADTVYNQCQSSILDMVDNYGLLNLDIAWCYLSLQSIAELPQVERRLNECETALTRSYGEDMERVIVLKGASGSEAALYVRLHLLQGITSYHMGHIEKSRFYLNKAESELSRLKVRDDSLVTLINMGYSEEESRIALRSCYGNLDTAVDWIIRKRDEKEQIKQLEKEDLKRKKLQKKLGKCINGDPVNTQLFSQLKDMGYNSYLISEALRRTNNDANESIHLMADPSFEGEILSSLVAKISEQPSTSAASPLASAVANLSEIAASLPNSTNSESVINDAVNAMANNPTAVANAINAIKIALNKTFSDEELSSITPTISEEEIKLSKKAYDTLAKDINSENDYIDLTLGPESSYLEQYKALLASL